MKEGKTSFKSLVQLREEFNTPSIDSIRDGDIINVIRNATGLVLILEAKAIEVDHDNGDIKLEYTGISDVEVDGVTLSVHSHDVSIHDQKEVKYAYSEIKRYSKTTVKGNTRFCIELSIR